MSVIDAARGGALTLLEVSFEVGEGVPILGQILALGNVIRDTIEKLHSADDKLSRLITDIRRLDPIVKKFDGKKDNEQRNLMEDFGTECSVEEETEKNQQSHLGMENILHLKKEDTQV